MKRHKNFKNVVAILLSVVMVLVMMPCQVFAAESTEVETVEPGVEPRAATYTDCLMWDCNSSSATVKLSHNFTTSSYKEYKGILSRGSSAVLVLGFKSQDSNDYYSLAFICDSTSRIEHPGVTIPAGYYTVTKASFPSSATLSAFVCNFVY